MKKRNQITLRRVLCCLLPALLLLLQGCLQMDAGGDHESEESTTPTNSGYLYQTMNYTYKTDITPYLPYIATGMSQDYLLLVNKSYSLDAGYAPQPLVNLNCKTNPNNSRTERLQEGAAMALYAMLAEMAADGVTDLFVTSSYRTYDRQVSLYNGYIDREMAKGLSRQEAIAVVATYSAAPGQSEHQSGLCVDFGTMWEYQNKGEVLTEAFEETEAYAWLSENCHRFGFILRYPASKVDRTGYSYEPWHYRFVGREAATEIMMRGICLEEFLGH